MPAAPSALAAAPASACLRVSRTLLLRRLDDDETAQDAVEIPAHFSVAQRRRDMFAHRVQRALVAPRVEHVPLVRVLVDVVDGRGDAGGPDAPRCIAEARNQLPCFGIGVHTL